MVPCADVLDGNPRRSKFMSAVALRQVEGMRRILGAERARQQRGVSSVLSAGPTITHILFHRCWWTLGSSSRSSSSG